MCRLGQCLCWFISNSWKQKQNFKYNGFCTDRLRSDLLSDFIFVHLATRHCTCAGVCVFVCSCVNVCSCSFGLTLDFGWFSYNCCCYQNSSNGIHILQVTKCYFFKNLILFCLLASLSPLYCGLFCATCLCLWHASPLAFSHL